MESRERRNEEQGVALVVTLIMLLLVTVIGLYALNETVIGMKTSNNVWTSKQAFYIAEAGLEVAREALRVQVASPNNKTLTQLLTASTGPDNVLVNSIAMFNFPSDDVAFVNTTAFGGGSFIVYLTNDAADTGGVTSKTDTNNIVTLTSFGYGPNNPRAVVQASVTASPSASGYALPAFLTILGPGIDFQTPDSKAFTMSGDATHAAITVNTTAVYNGVINGIKSQQYGNYTGTGLTPSVQAVDPGLPWNTITGTQSLQNLYTTLLGWADFTSPGQAGFTLGQTGSPKIVVLNQDYSSQNTSGAGILWVTGELDLGSNFVYNGLIVVVGKGRLHLSGGGNASITGGIIVANINGPDNKINTADDVFGNTEIHFSGGGNATATMSYSSNSQTQLFGGSRTTVTRTSWKPLLQ